MSEVCVDSRQLANVSYSLGKLFDLLNKTQGNLEKNKMLFSESNKDEKSKEIIAIIVDCQKSIKIVQRELYSCHQKLAKLNETAMEYDQIRLVSEENELLNTVGSTMLSFALGTLVPSEGGFVERSVERSVIKNQVSSSISDFADAAMPVLSNVSEQLMEQVHETYDTQADRFMREHPFRDEDGSIV